MFKIVATPEADRRTVLRGISAVGAGLVLGMFLPARPRAGSGAADLLGGNAKGDVAPGQFAPNAFLRIAPDSTVTVLVKHLEFGQGPLTGLTTLVAEELDADWSQMRGELAPAHAAYNNLLFGMQGTGGSTAIANSYEQMRKAGATARAMLVAAAAQAWGVPQSEIAVAGGIISHTGTNKNAKFGDFAEAASRLSPPENVALKSRDEFKLIGTDVPKLDSEAKSTGKEQFTIDMKRPDMLTVLLARPPLFGAKVKSFDDAAARQIPGVVEVKQIPQGVAVYGKGFWPAKLGRDALQIEWDETGAETRSTDEIIADYREKSRQAGRVVASAGDAEQVLPTSEKTLEAEYVFPFLAQAPMEPLDCVVEADQSGGEAWAGSQLQTVDQAAIARILGCRPEALKLHTMMAGGSFGRRATPVADVASEAAEAAKALGRKQPVKFMFSREDDLQAGFYRPLVVHRLKGGIDKDGNIAVWDQVIVGQSIVADTPFAVQMKDGIDPSVAEGADDLPYQIPNMRVSTHQTSLAVPPLWWRSVGHTHTAYAVETFVDELLTLAGKDPVEGRLGLLGDKHPRHAGVLRAAAELADWGGPVPDGRARGVAVHKSFKTYVAEIAEVSVGPDRLPRVHKVWCAVDCGVAVNPNIIRAQMEGGIGYGLGHALHAEITLNKGRVEQSNFDSYRSLRINEMPEVEVAIIKSAEAPTGVGEPGVPPIAPAVANAWAKLTGARVRQLPFARHTQS